jgi:SAM-dependent methyltransferase
MTAAPAVVAPPPRPCPLCDATAARALHVRAERRIVRCACGLVFVDPLPSVEEAERRETAAIRGEIQEETRAMFAAYGRGYRADDPVVRAFVRHLATLAPLAPGRRLLDVGVGTGLFLHLAREAGWEASGVDLSPEAAARATAEFGAPVTVGEFTSAPLAGPYDAISMGDVLEHSRDPRAFLARARQLLVPGGVLYVAVPNHRSLAFMTVDLLGRIPGGGGFADRLYVPYHYQYFNPPTLARALGESGFAVERLERENPHLARYRMHPVVRVGLAAILAASRAVRLEARLVVFARRR